jgi:DNA-directed RNA polymerase specialized sigma24 family protein
MDRTCHPPDEEERLVAQCLQGQDTAWETLFHLYHPRLVNIIKALIHNEGGMEQAEEIAARVWGSLCAEEYVRLRRYTPGSGCLLSYLASMARRQIWRMKRTETSRHSRECNVARREGAWDDIGGEVAIQEFLATLTRREREFCLSELLNQARPASRSSISRANNWQLRCRVLKKFRRFFLSKKSV